MDSPCRSSTRGFGAVSHIRHIWVTWTLGAVGSETETRHCSILDTRTYLNGLFQTWNFNSRTFTAHYSTPILFNSRHQVTVQFSVQLRCRYLLYVHNLDQLLTWCTSTKMFPGLGPKSNTSLKAPRDGSFATFQNWKLGEKKQTEVRPVNI